MAIAPGSRLARHGDPGRYVGRARHSAPGDHRPRGHVTSFGLSVTAILW
ncbi:MAG: hypothetical protein Q6373_017265 [Candidatus Sigynarchaeota archaeon]